MNKKGLSTVVTTLIIVMMSLVAVGIIWVVIQSLTKGGAEQVDYSSKCLLSEVKIQEATYNGKTQMATVLLKRNAVGGKIEAIGGVNIAFTKADGTSTTGKYENNIEVLEVASFTSEALGSKPADIISSVFFTKADGTEFPCQGVDTFTGIGLLACTNTAIGGACEAGPLCTAPKVLIEDVTGCTGATPICCA